MISMQYLALVGFSIVSIAVGDSFYDTPQLDDQFANFRITNAIPRGGSAAGGDIQDPVNVNPIDQNYVIFEFKGKGNARLLFQEDGAVETQDVCLVIIGGGDLYNEVNVFKSKTSPASIVGGFSIPNITSESEFRPFWIQWFDNTTNIHRGTGYEPGVSEIGAPREALRFQVNALSISTTSDNNGSWHFNVGEMTTSISQTKIITPTADEKTSSTDSTATSNTTISIAAMSYLSTLQTTTATSPSFTVSGSSSAITNDQATLRTTATTSATITTTIFPNTSQYTATEITPAELTTAQSITTAAVTSGRTTPTSNSSFFSQPVGIVVVLVGAIILFITGAYAAWRLYSFVQGAER